jgi:hypothetical protein
MSNMQITDVEIAHLLQAQKKITSPKPMHLKTENRNYRLELDAESVGLVPVERYKLFFRQSTELTDRFSIGLRWQYQGEWVLLTRYNGAGHEHFNSGTDGRRFTTFHKHLATEEAQMQGLNLDHHAVEAHYVSFQAAVVAFFKDLHFTNYSAYLSVFNIPASSSTQLGLFP